MGEEPRKAPPQPRQAERHDDISAAFVGGWGPRVGCLRAGVPRAFAPFSFKTSRNWFILSLSKGGSISRGHRRRRCLAYPRSTVVVGLACSSQGRETSCALSYKRMRTLSGVVSALVLIIIATTWLFDPRPPWLQSAPRTRSFFVK